MSHWNYRVIRKHHTETDSVTYHVHEVYYRDDGYIEGWTQESVSPMCETAAELGEDRTLEGMYKKAEQALAELYQQAGRLEFDRTT